MCRASWREERWVFVKEQRVSLHLGSHALDAAGGCLHALLCWMYPECGTLSAGLHPLLPRSMKHADTHDFKHRSRHVHKHT